MKEYMRAWDWVAGFAGVVLLAVLGASFGWGCSPAESPVSETPVEEQTTAEQTTAADILDRVRDRDRLSDTPMECEAVASEISYWINNEAAKEGYYDVEVRVDRPQIRDVDVPVLRDGVRGCLLSFSVYDELGFYGRITGYGCSELDSWYWMGDHTEGRGQEADLGDCQNLLGGGV